MHEVKLPPAPTSLYIRFRCPPARDAFRITVKVVTLPGTFFDGTDRVAFEVTGVGVKDNDAVDDDDDADDDDDGNPVAVAAAAIQQAQGGSTSTSSSPQEGDTLSMLPQETDTSSSQEGTTLALQETSTGGGSSTVSFDVTFFHCEAGSFWNRSTVYGTSRSGDEYTGTCELCAEDDGEGGTEVCARDGHGVRQAIRCFVCRLVAKSNAAMQR